jgi:hypothetical protein
MSLEVLVTVSAEAGLFIGLWALMAKFDKRNEERFYALEKQIDEMVAELTVEIKK